MMYSNELTMGIVSGLLAGIPSVLFGVAVYVLTALSLYTIAQRRGLSRPWLAWIPVVSSWIMGSLSDQYRYVVKGENRSKRKFLLVMSILSAVLSTVVCVMCVVVAVQAVFGVMQGFQEDYLVRMVMEYVVSLLGLLLVQLGVMIAYAVIRYMALYDVYKSLDPANSVLYLVLSILVSPTEPFFLFFNRNKDTGMPPRRPAPEQPRQEPRETDNKDYL